MSTPPPPATPLTAYMMTMTVHTVTARMSRPSLRVIRIRTAREPCVVTTQVCLRGGPDDTWGGYGFLGKKNCLVVKLVKKIVCLVKTTPKKVCSQNWQKNGVIWGGGGGFVCSFA